MTIDEKNKELDKIINNIQAAGKKKGINVPLNKASELDLSVEVIPTGNPILDHITGGGWPVGHMSILWGSEGVGKSCTALQTIAEQQKEGHACIYFTTEGRPSDQILKMLGVNKDLLYILEPQDYVEKSIDLIENIIYDESKKASRSLIRVLVIDSIQNFVGKRAVDKLQKEGAEGNNMMVRAKVLEDLIQRLQGRGMMQNLVVLLVAQHRANVNAVSAHSPKEILSGGFAVKYGPKLNVRLRMVKKVADKITGRISHHVVSASVEKNNTTGYMGFLEYEVLRPDANGNGGGIDDSQILIDKAEELGYLVSPKRGQYILYLPKGDVHFVAKKEERINVIKYTPDIKAELQALLRQGKPKTPIVASELPVREAVYGPPQVEEADE